MYMIENSIRGTVFPCYDNDSLNFVKLIYLCLILDGYHVIYVSPPDNSS